VAGFYSARGWTIPPLPWPTFPPPISRLYFYGKPGVSQRTSLRLNATLKDELANAGSIDVYVAVPPDLEWNGLPVHGAAGLELGLIKRYALAWNMRSAG
jgi:hypothetical protein